MNWLAWALAGALIVALWFLAMVLAAFGGGSNPPFAGICVVFGAIAMAWLSLGIAGAFGVYPRVVWGSL